MDGEPSLEGVDENGHFSNFNEGEDSLFIKLLLKKKGVLTTSSIRDVVVKSLREETLSLEGHVDQMPFSKGFNH